MRRSGQSSDPISTYLEAEHGTGHQDDVSILDLLGSKAQEAQFVATCVAGRRGARDTVLTVGENGSPGPETLEQARQQIDSPDLQPPWVEVGSDGTKRGAWSTPTTAEERDGDSPLMGRHGRGPMGEVFLRSVVDCMLR